jgi:hypothetical protein
MILHPSGTTQYRCPASGPETGLVVVSLSGVTIPDAVALVWKPRDVVADWSSPPSVPDEG